MVALHPYPDGINGGFNAFVYSGQADDVGLRQALAEQLVRDQNADPDRVYLGISTGTTSVSGRRPRRPVSVITFIGDQDGYAGRFEGGIRSWRERLRCVAVKPAPKRPAGNVTLSRAQCADGSDLDVYTVEGMGHSWPGATAGTNAAPDAGVVAADLLWRFFAAHPRSG